jgi:DNA-directed RNA polymerase specialized sigma24 family protein
LSEPSELTARAEEGDPLAALVARERWAEVVVALNRLTSEQRLVVHYRLILGWPTEKVAQVMGKPANAIYGLQFRALASLTRYLRENERGNEASGPIIQNDASERKSEHGA